ncbi:biopolymer transporter ExbD [Nitratireductor indicus]|uniref:Biopolymer transport protein ExbD/TolR n=1 Tax=Nitratireductor indicus C115 TaxID=1231190 RepID=K2N8Q3_9HYPH|nr:biopolymer transporter ExbD [Nitratireductor indicus]EKF43878.1 biopolymer transport protein ExbD/TolR [Nitratireductor indicus C115]MDS1135469.1 biopolymer transporter ExbD [Nitratireductor indicus]
MRIEAHAPFRRRPLSLTSLIDVIFLLLLFFMLSSTFTRFARVEVSGGPASASVSGKTPDILIRLDGEDGWRINGQTLDEDAAVAELLRLGDSGAETAVLLVRGELTSQALVSAVERIRRDTSLTLSITR